MRGAVLRYASMSEENFPCVWKESLVLCDAGALENQ